MGNRVLLVYFSGTGGTKRIADTFEDSFIQKNYAVTKYSLEKAEYELFKEMNKNLLEEMNLILLLYPVYATEAPILVHEWINSLPISLNIPAVVISVSGGGEVWPNTSCRVNVIKAFEKKKYNVVYERMMVMPSNIFTPVNDHVAMHLLKCIPEKVNKIVNDILNGKKRRTRLHISTYFFSLMHNERKTKKFAKSLSVKDSCTACGWCVKNCPRENLKMEAGTPAFGDLCIGCFRCIYGCPHRSIYLKKGDKFVLKDGYDIDGVEKRMQNIPLEPIEKCCKGLLFIGVKKYLLEKD
ncbi:MAG: EFR1 family ferrodoxin [Clostridia bacterium]|nr:EFR1 family ferrodoxin [Clostridia bacterium]